MTHPTVLELWEMLEAKKGNTASQLSCLDNWLRETKSWSFGVKDFGETFKFFKSNASTAGECASKFAVSVLRKKGREMEGTSWVLATRAAFPLSGR